MNNATIVFNESIELMKSGILKPTAETVTMEYADGSTETVNIPEVIHTFDGWKKLGFSVRKGEKAVAKFPIWKYTVKMLDTDTGSEELDKMNANINAQGGSAKMFMKSAAWFTREQVEPLKARATVPAEMALMVV